MSSSSASLAAGAHRYVLRIPGAWRLHFLCAASPSIGAEIGLDQPVDALRITTLTGVQIASACQRGRVLVINLWATGCARCREEVPAIDIGPPSSPEYCK